jgi:hypothetical protein
VEAQTHAELPGSPVAALAGAAAVSIIAVAATRTRVGGAAPLTEVDIGLVAWALVLAVFGAQGLVAMALEGCGLRPGYSPPRLSGALGIAIGLGCLLLYGLTILLGGAILTGQTAAVVGTTAGAGPLLLGCLLMAYKAAFVGDEVRVDRRRDGVPW